MTIKSKNHNYIHNYFFGGNMVSKIPLIAFAWSNLNSLGEKQKRTSDIFIYFISIEKR